MALYDPLGERFDSEGGPSRLSTWGHLRIRIAQSLEQRGTEAIFSKPSEQSYQCAMDTVREADRETRDMYLGQCMVEPMPVESEWTNGFMYRYTARHLAAPQPFFIHCMVDMQIDGWVSPKHRALGAPFAGIAAAGLGTL